MTTLKIKILEPELNKDIKLPKYMTSGSSGMDLAAAVKSSVTLKPGDIQLIPTAIAIALEKGYEAQIRPRSGLAIKNGITVVNAPGTIDSDYRGEIKIGLINLGKEDFIVERGLRVAQMVIQKVEMAEILEVEEIDKTKRNHGGFGHTGV